MACNSSNSSCQTKSNKLVVTKESSLVFNIQLTDKNTCEPFSLAGFQGATAFFPMQDVTDALAVTGSVLSSDLGKLAFSLTEADTALLNEGEDQNFEIEVKTTAETIIKTIEQKLSVIARLF